MLDSPESLASESSQSVEALVAEGQKCLEAGDHSRAHAYFVTATQLSPSDENIWLRRAQTAADPEEAVECFEQVLALNPHNEQARQKVTWARMAALRQEATLSTVIPANSPNPISAFLASGSRVRKVAIGLFIAVGAMCLLLGFGIPVWAVWTYANAGTEIVGTQVVAQLPTQVSFVLPPIWTPVPTRVPTPVPTLIPAPVWKTTRSVTVRSGPGVNYNAVGTLPAATVLNIVARSADGKFLEITYPNVTALAWVPADSVNIAGPDLLALPSAVSQNAPSTVRPPTMKPTPKPTNTPVPPMDFNLGRPVESIADCSKPWQVMGTVYDSQTGAQRVNGILVRVWVYGQVQGTVATGSVASGMTGFWAWTFNQGSQVSGQVAIVNSDGGLRSQPVNFQLTSRCDGPGATNVMVIDFAGK
ncbi:MAG: hypothetical protein HY782_16215 [Chloroflexi bacterium]|nr:hypothetical protein [Chloroflexota bacterium]